MSILKKEDRKALESTPAKDKQEPKTDLPMSEQDEEKQAEARTQRLAKKAQSKDSDK